MSEPETTQAPELQRRLGFFQATALNMANMIGVGPFLTIPDIVAKLPGGWVMLGWGLGLVLALCDSMMWCELGAAFPRSGGTYHYLREAFRGTRFSRFLPFLFVWQFIFSGPLEAASGAIGFMRYLDYLLPQWWLDTPWLGHVAAGGSLTLTGKTLASLLIVAVVVVLFRRIEAIGRLTVLLWAGVIVTVALAIGTAAVRFSPAQAFTFPKLEFADGRAFAMALGGAMSIAIYDFLGYYDICYVGDEVREPSRTIPRAVVVSLLVVAAIYIGLNIGVLGVLPVEKIKDSPYVFAVLVESVAGAPFARLFTGLILWTAFASVFALLLGYSRIPFAAAREGLFFRQFAAIHPTRGFPHISLLVVGAVTVGACWFEFMDVLTALITSRLLAQFVAQIGAVVALRRLRPDVPMPFRMWAYPLPCIGALVGWAFIFLTSGSRPIKYALVTLSAGVATFVFLALLGRSGFSKGEKE